MTNLKNKVVFITGASRGIGRAMALRSAKEGAHVIICAKTVDSNSKKEGTIYETEEMVKALGAQSLAIPVDVRFQEQVQEAVKQVIEKFGRIDVLINNAGAISLTNTEQTAMKRFDLIHSVNVRAAFMCTQECLPYLKKSSNPHILNLSPPLNLDKRWFKDYAAYTVSKYSMSMLVLGMSEEFKQFGIAVNALWPKTIIATAAISLVAGNEALQACRSPEIVADAAAIILSRPASKCTGNLFIDEDILESENITELHQYAVNPKIPLQNDLFID